MPREPGLICLDDGTYVLTQHPVSELTTLRTAGPVIEVLNQPLSGQSTVLDPLGCQALELSVVLEPGTAREIGLLVRRGLVEQTAVGYNAERGVVFLDRTASGSRLLRDQLPARHEAPYRLDATGSIGLTILVDHSSVEIFTADGQVVLTYLILPSPDSRGTQLYAEGGAGRIRSLRAWNLERAIR